MDSALLYKMTIWYGPSYDESGRRGVLTIEAYFKVALWGSVNENRNNYLPDIGIPFFQEWVSDEFGMYIPESEINVKFEPEQSAETEDAEITVDFRVMTYRGKHISAQSYSQQTIPLEDSGSAYDPEYEQETAVADEDDEYDEDDDENDEDDEDNEDGEEEEGAW